MERERRREREKRRELKRSKGGRENRLKSKIEKYFTQLS